MTEEQLAATRKRYERIVRFPKNLKKWPTFEAYLADQKDSEPQGGKHPDAQFLEWDWHGSAHCPKCDALLYIRREDYYQTLTPALKKEFNQLVEDILAAIKTAADPKIVRIRVRSYVQALFRMIYEYPNARDYKDLSTAAGAIEENLEFLLPRHKRIGGRKGEGTISEELAQRLRSVQEAEARQIQVNKEIDELRK